MKKFDELLSKLQKMKITQTSCWEEDIPQEIWSEYFNNYSEVADRIDVDSHRWYETSITVIEILNGYLGIRHISNMASEESDFESCCVELQFYEMEKIEKPTYQIVTNK